MSRANSYRSCNDLDAVSLQPEALRKIQMSMSGDKPAILVTGGAGYIGSHAVLALLDAGWPVVVIDNLVTGFRWAVPEGAVFAEGDIADQDLVGRLIEEHGIRAIIHFAGSIVVPESVENPLKYYENNTVKSRSLIESAVRAESALHLFLDRGDLRHTGARSDHGGCADPADQPLWLVEADDRADAGRRLLRPPAQPLRASILQRRRR
jgi:hypothetical protein